MNIKTMVTLTQKNGYGEMIYAFERRKFDSGTNQFYSKTVEIGSKWAAQRPSVCKAIQRFVENGNAHVTDSGIEIWQLQNWSAEYHSFRLVAGPYMPYWEWRDKTAQLEDALKPEKTHLHHLVTKLEKELWI